VITSLRFGWRAKTRRSRAGTRSGRPTRRSSSNPKWNVDSAPQSRTSVPRGGRLDVRRQGHVERCARREERVERAFAGLRHVRLSGRGEVHPAEAVLRAPLELGDARVDVPERQLREPERAATRDVAESTSQRCTSDGRSPRAPALLVVGSRSRANSPVERHRLTVEAVVEDDPAGHAVVVHVVQHACGS